jgi:hypothetical protein
MTGTVAMYHNPYNQWMHVICTGDFTAAEFRQALLDGIHAAGAHHCADLILDCVLASKAAFAPVWTAGDWLRAAEANGLKRLAFVHSPLSAGVPAPGGWSGNVAFFPCHNLTRATQWLTGRS